MDISRFIELLALISQSTLWRILVIFVVALILHRVIGIIVTHFMRRVVNQGNHLLPLSERQSNEDVEKRAQTISGIFITALLVTMWIIVILVILSELGVNIAAMATGAGLAGVIIGFGAQNVIKDYLAGIFIILEDQYRVGDTIKLEGTGSSIPISGTVEQITIRMTRLRDLDGNVHTVLNSTPTSATNMSYKSANANLDIPVSYDTDIDRLEEIINHTGEKLAQDFPAETLEPIQFMRVNDFSENAIIVKCLGKVTPGSQWEISGAFRREIKKVFEKEGIVIPFNQLVVNLRTTK